MGEGDKKFIPVILNYTTIKILKNKFKSIIIQFSILNYYILLNLYNIV